MRPVVFVGRVDLPSFRMLGQQVGWEMSRRGLSVQIVTEMKEARQISNSIIVVVKVPFFQDIQIWKRQNNEIWFHVVDRLAKMLPSEYPSFASFLNQFDGLFLTHEAILLPLRSRLTCPSVILPHHWDPMLGISICPSSTPLKIGYVGDFGSMERGLSHSLTLVREHGIRILDTNSGRDVTQEYQQRGTIIAYPASVTAMKDLMDINFSGINAQISVRKDGDSRYKPAVKLATAARMKMPLLTTKDAGVLELLPSTYPYFLDSAELGDVLDGITKMRRTYGGPVWKNALQLLEKVAEETNLGTRLGDRWFDTLIKKT